MAVANIKRRAARHVPKRARRLRTAVFGVAIVALGQPECGCIFDAADTDQGRRPPTPGPGRRPGRARRHLRYRRQGHDEHGRTPRIRRGPQIGRQDRRRRRRTHENDFGFTRYTTTGSLDASFDGDGIANVDVAFSDVAVDLAIQSDGKIVAVGSISIDGFCCAAGIVRWKAMGPPMARSIWIES